MEKYVYKLGVPENWGFVDVYDLTSDGLKSVPQPVLGILLLFPKSEVSRDCPQ